MIDFRSMILDLSRIIDKKIGPLRLRAWGLILNFTGNAMALYGAVGYLQNGNRLGVLITGILITILCIVFLALPSRTKESG